MYGSFHARLPDSGIDLVSWISFFSLPLLDYFELSDFWKESRYGSYDYRFSSTLWMVIILITEFESVEECFSDSVEKEGNMFKN